MLGSIRSFRSSLAAVPPVLVVVVLANEGNNLSGIIINAVHQLVVALTHTYLSKETSDEMVPAMTQSV